LPQDGANGRTHHLSNAMWIVNYDKVRTNTGRVLGWTVMIARNCQAFLVGGKAWDWYRNGNRWNIYGAPITDTAFDHNPGRLDGTLDWQAFDKATYTYSYNLKMGTGFANLGSWT